jgi:F-type H+-transporting ATPase subunit b
MKIATEIVTHVVAFLLFVIILYVTAWKPLLKVIDDRRNKIAADFKKAEDLAADAEKARAGYETSLKQIEGEARQKMHEGIEEGKRIAAEIQQRAHDEADQIIKRAHATADIEMANARKELRKEVIELTLALTEKVLREQLDRGEHTRYIDRYIDELGGMKS